MGKCELSVEINQGHYSILFKAIIEAQLDSSQHAQAETKISFRLHRRGQRGVQDSWAREPYMS